MNVEINRKLCPQIKNGGLLRRILSKEHVLHQGEIRQNGQKRLVDVDRLSDEGEVRENETDGVPKKHEREIEEKKRMIQVTSNSLENKEDDDLNIRLRAITSKEKDADIKMMNLENKERYLLSKEENLNAHERALGKQVSPWSAGK